MITAEMAIITPVFCQDKIKQTQRLLGNFWTSSFKLWPMTAFFKCNRFSHLSALS